jgi:hypothetical protein
MRSILFKGCINLNFLINSYLGEFADTAGRSEFQGKLASDEIIGNPLQAFQLVKRLTINWKRIQNKMKNYDWNSKDIIKL